MAVLRQGFASLPQHLSFPATRNLGTVCAPGSALIHSLRLSCKSVARQKSVRPLPQRDASFLLNPNHERCSRNHCAEAAGLRVMLPQREGRRHHPQGVQVLPSLMLTSVLLLVRLPCRSASLKRILRNHCRFMRAASSML